MREFLCPKERVLLDLLKERGPMSAPALREAMPDHLRTSVSNIHAHLHNVNILGLGWKVERTDGRKPNIFIASQRVTVTQFDGGKTHHWVRYDGSGDKVRELPPEVIPEPSPAPTPDIESYRGYRYTLSDSRTVYIMDPDPIKARTLLNHRYPIANDGNLTCSPII